jgi:hypothetical protein
MIQPIYPSAGTLGSRALALLLKGEAITHKDFQRHAGSYRLGSFICDLRAKCWPIQDNWEVVPTGDPTKRSAKVKRYSLVQAAITSAGEEGREFVRKVGAWEAARINQSKSAQSK